MKKHSFSTAMMAATNAALDQGVFYQDHFAEFCIAHMGGYGCEANLVATVEIDRTIPDSWAEHRDTINALEEQIATMPRGSYVVLRKTSMRDDSLHITYSTIVSDGSGELSVGGKYDIYDQPPPPEKVLERMLGQEIYCCRDYVQNERRMADDRLALDESKLSAGLSFKNYRPAGEIKPYSKTTIESVNAETGTVTLFMSRRGTTDRWRVTVGARSFCTDLDLLNTKIQESSDFVLG